MTPPSATIDELGELLDPGDILVDGGNSHYTDDQKHAAELADQGHRLRRLRRQRRRLGPEERLRADGRRRRRDTSRRLMPIFETLKPEGEDGFVHAGEVGAGHFAKMVHNGIEYGMMQAFAEGWELLEASDIVTDVPGRLQELAAGHGHPLLAARPAGPRARRGPEPWTSCEGYAQDSGEGRWTVQAAVDHAVPLPVITAALYARFASRQDDSPAMKVVAALRNQFGGHAVTSRRARWTRAPTRPAPTSSRRSRPRT